MIVETRRAEQTRANAWRFVETRADTHANISENMNAII